MKFNVTISSPSPLIALGNLLFNGSAVWLSGGWVTDDTPFTVQLDSQSYSGTRQPASSDLWSQQGLDTSLHNLTVTPANILDTVQVGIDVADGSTQLMVDDASVWNSSSTVVQGSWTANQCLSSGRVGGTCHGSSAAGASVAYTFNGEAVTIWGAVEDNAASYTVAIDTQSATPFHPANQTSSRPIVALGHYSHLGVGQHTITLTNTGTSTVEIDYLEIYTSSKSSSSGSSSSGGSHIGVIIAVIAAALALCIFGIAGFVFWKKRRSPTPRQPGNNIILGKPIAPQALPENSSALYLNQRDSSSVYAYGGGPKGDAGSVYTGRQTDAGSVYAGQKGDAGSMYAPRGDSGSFRGSMQGPRGETGSVYGPPAPRTYQPRDTNSVYSEGPRSVYGAPPGMDSRPSFDKPAVGWAR